MIAPGGLAPRVEIDLSKITHNARNLAGRLARRGISVSAVTKSTLGSVSVAQSMIAGGVAGLADSRLANLSRLREGRLPARLTLLRPPMAREIESAVATADASLNTESATIARLSVAALRRGGCHDVIVMVELGDLREGVMPEDLATMLRGLRPLRGVRVIGIGANLACRAGVAPDTKNMASLNDLVEVAEAALDRQLEVVSAGNSASLGWALSGKSAIGRVNDLRLGEAIILGTDPLDRRGIPGLKTDAVTIFGEVIESKIKPSKPWGVIGQAAFGSVERSSDGGRGTQALVALGHQDIDPADLTPPTGIEIVAASSDHLVLRSQQRLAVAEQVPFVPGYSALIRAMASPFVTTVLLGRKQPAGTGRR